MSRGLRPRLRSRLGLFVRSSKKLGTRTQVTDSQTYAGLNRCTERTVRDCLPIKYSQGAREVVELRPEPSVKSSGLPYRVFSSPTTMTVIMCGEAFVTS